MPELPEVDHCGRTLQKWANGRRVVAVVVHDPRSVRASRTARPSEGREDGAAALAAVVTASPPGPMERHGKRLLWRFGDGALLLHLGMTGRWTRTPHPHAKVTLTLDDGAALTFADPRLLGGIVPTSLVAGRTLLHEGLGPDALDDPFPPLTGRRAVKLALMDQAVVAGLGNLHAAEALWRARIAPDRPAETVTGERHTRLAEAVRDQLQFARRLLDAEEEVTYVEDAGAPNPFPVYQRDGEPCPRCGREIERFVQGGRGTWWCRGCQDD